MHMPILTETVNLDPDEKIVGIFRSHSFGAFRRLALPAFGLCVLFLFLFPLFRLGFWGVFLFVGLCVADIAIVARILISWYGTVYILTTRRLFGMRRFGFFKKQTQEILLENISELSAKIHGPFSVLFRFGDVALMLYTSSHSYTLHEVTEPQEVLTAISHQISRAKKLISGDESQDLAISEDNLKKGRVHRHTGKKHV